MKSVLLRSLKGFLTVLVSSFFASWQMTAQVTCVAGEDKYIVEITGVSFSGEIAWAIHDGSGNVVDTVPPNTYSNGTVSTREVCLSNGASYSFRAWDTWGDSWNGGTYSVYRQCDNTVVANNGGASPDNGVSGSGSLQLEVTEVFSASSSACPSCLQPTSLTASNMTASTADLGWTESGTATVWDVEWGASGFTQGAGTTISGVSTNPYNLTGLMANTAYDFYVRADCGASGGSGQSSWAGPFTFTTAFGISCPTGAQSVIFTEEFDNSVGWTGDIVGSPSNGSWVFPFSGSPGSGNGPGGAHSGSNYMYVETSGSGQPYTANAISPVIDLSAGQNSAALTFYYHAFGATVGTLDVGVSSSPSGPWTSVLNIAGQQQASASAPFGLQSASLDAYLGQQIYIRFNYVSGTSFTGDVGIDLMNVYTCLTCPPPSALMTNNVTTNSVDVSWTTGGAVNAELEWGPAGFIPGNGIRVATTGTNYNLTGLNANTSYDIFVRDSCAVGDVSPWSGPISITTLCTPFTAPYAQNWDGLTPPATDDCWSEYIVGTGTGFSVAEIITTASSSPNSGPNHLIIDNGSNTSNDTIVAVSPQFSDLTAGDKRIRLFTKVTSSFDTDDLLVGSMTDPQDGSTITIFDTIVISGNTTYTEHTIEITTANGYNGTDTYLVLFHENTDGFSEIYVDDFNYEKIPTCPRPDNFTAANILSNSIDLSWTEVGSATIWDIEYGTPGFSIGSGTRVTGVTSNNPYTLSGLSPATTYDIYVRSFCSVTDSSIWRGPLNVTTAFRTAQPIVCGSALPVTVFSDDFTANNGWTGDLGDWEIPGGASSSGTGPSSAHSGSSNSYMNFEASGFPSGDSAEIFSPAIDLSTASLDAELSFWMHAYGSDMGTLKVAIGNSLTGPFTDIFTWSGQLQTSASAAWQNIGVDLTSYTGQQVYLRFTQIHNGSFRGDMSIDLVEVNACVTCPRPTALAANNITDNSADLSWTPGNTETTWEVEYGFAGFMRGMGTSTGNVTTNSPYTLTGLLPATDYDYYVRAVCGAGDSSLWAGPFTFSTPCSTPLAGTYTIDPALAAGGTNFVSMAAAENALNICGISGPVTFNIAPGTYNGSLELLQITGASAVNTVTFDGSDSALVELTHSSTTDEPTIYFNGADHVIIQNMTVSNTSSSDAWGIMFQNTSDSNTVNQVHVKMPVGTTTDVIGLVASNSLSFETSTGNNTNYLTVQNSLFTGGETGVHLTGGSTSAAHNVGNRILNNTFRMQDDHAIEVDGQDSLVIEGNDIADLQSSFADAVYLFDVNDFFVRSNTIISTDWALYINDGNDAYVPTSNSEVVNNMIVSETDAALYLFDAIYIDVYHNSTAGTIGLLINDDEQLDIRNNIFSSTGGFAFESVDPINATTLLNYNLYYRSDVGNLADDGNGAYADLAAWQVADGSRNVNSVTGDPLFKGANDLHVFGLPANDAGFPITSVATDIDGESRSATTPDIGADEYDVALDDAIAVQAYFDNSACNSLTDTVWLEVQNGGLNTITSLPVTIIVSGDIQDTVSNTLTVNIPAFATDTVVAGVFDSRDGGNFDITVYTQLVNDEDNSNDTAKTSGARFRAVPVITDVSCNGGSDGEVTVTLENAQGLDGSLTTSFASNNGAAGNMFDVNILNPTLNLNGFEVNLDPGTHTVDIYHKTGSYVGSENTAGDWTLIESITVTSAGTDQPTPLNLSSSLALSNGTNAFFLTTPTSNVFNYYNGGSTGSLEASNGDLEIFEGAGRATGGFSGSVFSPRVFSGSIIYQAGQANYVWSNGDTTATADTLTAGTYTLTATDGIGCTNTITVNVGEPMPLAISKTVSNATCLANTDGFIQVTPSGGTAPYRYIWNNGDTSATAAMGDTNGLGVGQYTLQVIDDNNCVLYDTTDIVVEDTVAPVVNLMSHTAYLDASGNVTIDSSAVENGSTDACGIATITLDVSSFTCNDLGPNTVTATVTDVNGNSASAATTITVVDTISPTASAQAFTVYLDGSGNASITGSDIDNGSTDACGIAALSVSPASFTCSEVGANTVTLTATDGSGNSGATTATVTVVDTISPTVVTQNINAYLDGSGNVTITPADVDNGSSDVCGLASLGLDITSFTCANVGANTVVLTATDVNGSSASGPATVTVIDTVSPVATSMPATIYLDANGTAGIIATDVHMSSTDACGVASLSVSPSAFGCSELGANTVVLTVTDNNGNSSSVSATVTVMDTIAPVISCANDTTVSNDPGLCGAVVNYDIPGAASGPSTETVVYEQLGNALENGRISNSSSPLYVADDISVAAGSCLDFNFVTANFFNNNPANVTGITVNIFDDNGGQPGSLVQGISLSPSDWDTSLVGNAFGFNALEFKLDLSQTVSLCGGASGQTYWISIYGSGASLSGTDFYWEFKTNIPSTDTAYAGSSPLSFPSAYPQEDYVFGLISKTTSSTSTASVSDNCSATVTQIDMTGLTSGSTFPVGTTELTYLATDPSGNTDTCSFTITVQDTAKPMVMTQDITIYLDGNGQQTIVPADVDNGSSDNCGIATLDLDTTNFDCDDIGMNPVVLTAIDVNGNSDTAWATVTVIDTVSPTVTTKNHTTYLDASGNATIDVLDVSSGSSSACSIDTVIVDITSFTCVDLGQNTVTVTATASGGTASNSATATVTVEDTISPNVVTQMFTTYLDASGNASIVATDVEGGSTDNCTVVGYSVDISTFDCNDLGANTVILTVTDQSGNTSSAPATVMVVDTITPVANSRDRTVYLDANGQVTITPAMVNMGSSDNCLASSTLSLSKAAYTCADEGLNQEYLLITDADGNVDSTDFLLTVLDTISPNMITKNITVQLGATGQVSIAPSQLDSASSDNCSNQLFYTASRTNFGCADLGINMVTLTATDVNGNSSSATAIVTVEDNLVPTANTQSVTLTLDASGNATLTPAMVNNGSIDNCSIASYSLSQMSFTCADLGTNTVSLTATDGSGNSASANATITVIDNMAPTALAQNATVQLDANGNATLTAMMVNNGSTDNCSISSMSVSPSSFDCADVGSNTVTLTVTDASGNSSSTTATVMVMDNVSPVVATRNISMSLDASGNATIQATDVNNGSADACGIATLSVSPSSFTCADLGANTVTLTATDANGNSSTGTATVTVTDNMAPTVVTQSYTAVLDANGQATITPADVNNGSSDNCSIVSYSLDVSTFTCNAIGQNAVNLTATDQSGNSATGTAIVSVVDNSAPTVSTQNITVQLNASGQVSIQPSQINSGSTDNCTIAGYSLDISTFTCADVGPNTVTLTATDGSGNSATGTATVTVVDNVSPTAVAQNITLQLDASGNATLAASSINNGSTDACGISTLSVSPSTFTCADLGSNSVTLTVTDNNGNSSTATATVTVVDNIAPTVITQNVTVYLNASGTASITAADVNNGSTDNCSVSTTSVSQTSFSCADRGQNLVTLTVTDGSGNSASAGASVIVVDTISPSINNLPANITAYATAQSCAANVSWTNITGADNCSVASVVTSQSNGSSFNLGNTMVSVMVTDGAGNTSSGSFMVTVVDTIAPVFTAVPSNISITPNPNSCDATVTWSAPSASDNCSNATISTSVASGSTFNVGNTTVTYTATDAAGNSRTGSFVVTVTDQVAPTISNTPANIVTANDAGACNAVVNYTMPAVGDNCTGASISSSHPSGGTFPVGTTNVTFTATDGAGNTSNSSFTITVEDREAPVATSVPASDTVGQCNATYTYTTPTGTDNCSAVTVRQVAGLPSGAVFPAGPTVNQFELIDASGNRTFVNFTIFIVPQGIPQLPSLLEICANADPVAITGGQNISWTGNGIINGGTTFDPGRAGAGRHALNYVFTDDQGCQVSGTIQVTVTPQPNKPVVSKIASNTLSTGNYNDYQWYRDGIAIPGATNQNYTYSVGGNYQVMVGNSFACTNYSDGFVVGSSGGGIGLDEEILAGLEVYPNPSNGIVNVDLKVGTDKELSVTLFSIDGKKVYEKAGLKTNSSGNIRLDFGNLPTATYFLHIRTEDQVAVRKLLMN